MSITTDIIGFSILGKLHIGPVKVLGHFNDRFNSFNGFKLFSLSSLLFRIKTYILGAQLLVIFQV